MRPLPKKLALLISSAILSTAAFSTPALAGTPIFINEIHYDNKGVDTGEAIEIAGPSGTDLSNWSIVLYNGKDRETYNNRSLLTYLVMAYKMVTLLVMQ